jgi:hypothetical protein
VSASWRLICSELPGKGLACLFWPIVPVNSEIFHSSSTGALPTMHAASRTAMTRPALISIPHLLATRCTSSTAKIGMMCAKPSHMHRCRPPCHASNTSAQRRIFNFFGFYVCFTCPAFASPTFTPARTPLPDADTDVQPLTHFKTHCRPEPRRNNE